MRTRGKGCIPGRLGGALAVTALLVLPAGRVRAVDFLRGDANGDGSVSISDAYYSLNFLFSSGSLPECGDTADTNGDGRINISDAVHTLSFVVGAGPAPAAPFPAPGERIGPGVDFPCDSYGNGAPLEDPDAALAISRTQADGGDSRNASVTLAVSSSGPLGGLYAEIVDEAGVIDNVGPQAQKDGGNDDLFFLAARLEGGVVTVGFVTSLFARSVISAGANVDVVTIELCLKAGTVAGEYPLTLRTGELIAGCEDGGCGQSAGRAIHPQLTHGTLVVSEDVSAEAECEDRRPPAPPRVPTPDSPPPPPQLPPGLELAAEVRIGSADARPGEAIQVPYIVNCNGDVQGFAFSIDFDEEVLQATEIEERFTRPDSLANPFWVSAFNNANENPGNAGVDEGYVVAGAVMDLFGRSDLLPPDTDNEPVLFHFTVNRDAAVASTTLRFLDGGKVGPDQPGVQNNVTAYGHSVEAVEVDSIVLIDGILNILPDVSAFFLRGDANGDRELNVADPTFTLDYLFRSAAPPPCLDAADANDDGRVNLTDPIAVLQVLFQGVSRLPEPFDAPGADPSEDSLECEEGVR